MKNWKELQERARQWERSRKYRHVSSPIVRHPVTLQLIASRPGVTFRCRKADRPRGKSAIRAAKAARRMEHA